MKRCTGVTCMKAAGPSASSTRLIAFGLLIDFLEGLRRTVCEQDRGWGPSHQ